MFFSRLQHISLFLFAQDRGTCNPAGPPEDEDLIERIAAGDERALEVFYERYRGLVYGLVLRIVGDRGLAEDVSLDVFTRVWQQASLYRGERAAVKTWLASIARHRSIDLLRMRSSRLDGNSALWADGELEHLTVDDTPERNVTERDLRLRVRRAMAELPEEQRAVLALAYLKGLSHAEIAEQLQQPLGTVKGRIRAAMCTLQNKFAGNL